MQCHDRALRALSLLGLLMLVVQLGCTPTASGATSQKADLIEAEPDLEDCLVDDESAQAHIVSSASQHVTRADYNSEDRYEAVLYSRAMYPILRQYAWMDYMMYWKYRYGMIYGGPPPHNNPFKETSDQLSDYLDSVLESEKPAGILVYWRSPSQRRCVGLALPGRHMLVEASPNFAGSIASLLPKVKDQQHARLARLRTAIADDGQTKEAPDSVVRPSDLSDVAQQLIPRTIAIALAKGRVKSLLVMPRDDIGIVPFAALPVDAANEPLVKFTAITMGLNLQRLDLGRDVAAPTKKFRHVIVVGDPDLSGDPKWFFPDLPGARQEAIDIGKLVGAPPLLGQAATHSAVLAALKRPEALDLIYIATHAITDRANPQDDSFLGLNRGNLLTRDVEKLKVKGNPLVILSACQTGLGKQFDGGIFGMALAWHYSGAGAVVTSLWNVNDDTTRDLMNDFMRRVNEAPPSRAMAETMRHRLQLNPDYNDWASFVVYGALPTNPLVKTSVPDRLVSRPRTFKPDVP